MEAAGENAFYRNIIDEPDFPFHQILDASSDIARVVKQKFIGNGHEESELNGALGNVLRLDDAFCIHYNLQQHDTQCAKHTDPSDITVNMCLGCSDDMEGSMVVFFGMQPLLLTGKDCISDGTPAKEESGVDTKLPVEVDDGTAANKIVFAVKQNPGYATIHWGHHLHQTTRLTKGSRTNIVLTYCYKDKSRSKAHSRTCYVTS